MYRRENDNVRRIELSVIPRIDISTVYRWERGRHQGETSEGVEREQSGREAEGVRIGVAELGGT